MLSSKLVVVMAARASVMAVVELLLWLLSGFRSQQPSTNEPEWSETSNNEPEKSESERF